MKKITQHHADSISGEHDYFLGKCKLLIQNVA